LSVMPFSQTSQLTPIVSWVEQLSPRSVLDIGIGMGQYGFLLRTKLESLNLFHIEGDKGWLRPRNEWKVRIDGIEGYAGYITPVQEWSYNRLLIGDALECLQPLSDQTYELVMAIDVLEHFDKADGLRLLAEMRRVASKAALVSTPKDFIHQDVPANPLENHRSHWSLVDLQTAGYTEIIPNEESWIAIARA
ncbi:MAG TPA: class I SAM-dependent methyltransferase, partial [Candidatus Acidoferrum sp.]|nr:class I SAM-dependent methyltransferase [Candidatus Acidoferrum sp.]